MLRKTAALGVAILLAACSHTGMHAGSHPHVLRIGYLNDPSSLNPLFAYAQTQIDLADLYTETLVGLNSKNELVPLLAQRVPKRENGDISADGTTITYHLRHARFADGAPFTSADVLFTYRAILDPRNPVTDPDPYRRIASISAPDAHTVVIHLKERWAAATAELFAQSDFAYGILPAHAFGGNPDNVARGSWNDTPFGTGPFRVTHWKRGTEIALVPNPYAWRKPKLTSLVLKIYPDDAARLIALRTGEIDVTDVEGEQAVRAASLPGVRVVMTPMNGEYFLAFQTQRPNMNQLLVRRAISESVDRTRILHDALFGLNPSDTTEDPAVLWSFDASIPAISRNPQAAARDFDAAGWHLQNGVRMKNGNPLVVNIAFESTRAYWRRIAALVQNDLRQAGVQADLHGYTVTVFMGGSSSDVLHSGRFDIALTGFDNGSDPEQSEQFTCVQRSPAGSDFVRFCDPAYDAAYAVQRSTLNRAARRAAFFQMQRVLHRSYAADFIFTDVYHDALADGVTGWAPNMLFRYSNAERWDVN
jgi:peptide/nickel transport system substrate-binding protein